MTGTRPDDFDDSAVEAMSAAFGLSPDGLAVFEAGGHRCLAANDAFRDLVSHELDALSGLPGLAALFGPEVVALLEDVLVAGEPQSVSGVQAARATAPDVVVDLSLVPWRAEDGRVRGIVVRVVDVTENATRSPVARVSAKRQRDTRGIVTELQDALLPKGLPVVPGLDLAARYLLARDGAGSGGDWFDAVIRPGGRLALVVGDVVGHGVEASVAMGQLRAVLRGILGRGDHALPQVVAELDDYAAADPSARAATVCVVDIDPRTGRATYCSAGHPAPLVVDDVGRARFLEPTTCGPLGVGETLWSAAEVSLEPSDLVLLYTDGILERPGTSLSAATVDLARVAGAAALSVGRTGTRSERTAERVCQLTLERLTSRTGHEDDISLIAAQRVSRRTPLREQYPAIPTSAVRTRRAIDEWLTPLGVSATDVLAVQHALGELVVNAIEHAYAEGVPASAPEQFEINADLETDGVATFAVIDHGTWKDPGDLHEEMSVSGRGLAMAAAFADEFDVRRNGAGGTTATFRLRLGRPAVMLQDSPATVRRESTGAPYSATLDDELSARTGTTAIRVVGPLDSVTAEVLRPLIGRSTSGATRHATLHLGGVTHLGSRAVQLLYATRGLTVVAPMGSVAQQVLDLVRLPYRTD